MSAELNFQLKLAQLQHRYSMEYQMVQAMAAFEHAALKPLFLLNGGAAAGFTALYGASNIVAQSGPAFRDAIICWIIGLLCAVGASIGAAMSQFNFRKLRGVQVSRVEKAMGLEVERDDWDMVKEWEKRVFGYRRLAVVFGIICLAWFVLGVVTAIARIA